jgi:VIT1/CCC1 family predicted Fe2+/Mn2+ transporter
MASDNLLDVVERLEAAVADFRRLLYGDQATRSSGMITEFEGLRRRVEQLETRRPRAGLWVIGYLTFMAAAVCAIVGTVNAVVGTSLLDISPVLAFVLSVILAIAALVLFVTGFGWFEPKV